jgi:hypothetical protein
MAKWPVAGWCLPCAFPEKAVLALPQVVAFDVDASSLLSIREAFPGCREEVVNGATASIMASTWYPRAINLVVLGAVGDGVNALGLCRFLSFCTAYSTDFEAVTPQTMHAEEGQSKSRRSSARLLVLVSPAQEHLVQAFLETGADSCLVRPVHFKDVLGMLTHARAGNQPGRHTLNSEVAQREDLWRDAGGEG